MDMNRRLSEKELEMVCGGSKVNDLASEAATAIKDIGVEIAARICATTEALNAGMEVRITIQENTLKGTEVFITKNGKGDLAVMSIEAYEHFMGKYQLYSLIQDGIDDVNAGRVRDAGEAISKIMERRKK